VRILTCLAFLFAPSGCMTLGQNTGAEDEDAIPVILLCIDAEVRDRIAHWLKPLPIRTFVAEDGYQAYRILRDVPCRLLITDRLLPPWPGLGRINGLLALRPGFRTAFVDNGSPDGRWLAYAVGATDFLPWPLTRRSLVDLLTSIKGGP
jgi:DNA-binding NtrC family response regulator